VGHRSQSTQQTAARLLGATYTCGRRGGSSLIRVRVVQTRVGSPRSAVATQRSQARKSKAWRHHRRAQRHDSMVRPAPWGPGLPSPATLPHRATAHARGLRGSAEDAALDGRGVRVAAATGSLLLHHLLVEDAASNARLVAPVRAPRRRRVACRVATPEDAALDA